jgi:actin-related protein
MSGAPSRPVKSRARKEPRQHEREMWSREATRDICPFQERERERERASESERQPGEKGEIRGWEREGGREGRGTEGGKR